MARRSATRWRGGGWRRRRAGHRPQDRLHQPDDLGGIRRLLADLGPVYDTTFRDVDGPTTVSIAHLVEPRIEPEIVLGFKAPVTAGMDERAILGAVGWVAHGFEIVQSLFPGWRFQGADCQAAFGLHGALFCGPRTPVEGDAEGWLKALTTFAITLSRNGERIDHGIAANVLDGPLSAVKHLAGVLAADRQATPIAAGEIITTGTVTRAFRWPRARPGRRRSRVSR